MSRRLALCSLRSPPNSLRQSSRRWRNQKSPQLRAPLPGRPCPGLACSACVPDAAQPAAGTGTGAGACVLPMRPPGCPASRSISACSSSVLLPISADADAPVCAMPRCTRYSMPAKTSTTRRMIASFVRTAGTALARSMDDHERAARARQELPLSGGFPRVSPQVSGPETSLPALVITIGMLVLWCGSLSLHTAWLDTRAPVGLPGSVAPAVCTHAGWTRKAKLG